MLYANGMAMMQIKAGMVSEKSEKSSCLIGSNIYKPTNISAGAVAAPGIAKKMGEKNNAAAKQMAVTKAVMPVLPPSEMPEALST